MHYMVCISGFAGAGKDECASQLVKHHYAVQTGLADPGKRHMADAYGFTEQQLFGPSPFRNAGDVRIEKNSFRDLGLKRWEGALPQELQSELDPEARYWTFSQHESVLDGYGIKDIHEYRTPSGSGMWTMFIKEGDPKFWLSPREALQIYLEKMNQLDVYTWIRKGVEDQLLLATGRWGYTRMRGLVRADDEDFINTKMVDTAKDPITCFADFRHIPEIEYVRKLAARSLVPFLPILVRVKRPSIKKPPYNHRSETEQTLIRDAAFDFIVQNDQDLPHLYRQIDDIIRRAKSGDIPLNPWRDDYVVKDHNPGEGYIP
jgi:hypothetical protein